jgi:signal peptide peptidase SppA
MNIAAMLRSQSQVWAMEPKTAQSMIDALQSVADTMPTLPTAAITEPSPHAPRFDSNGNATIRMAGPMMRRVSPWIRFIGPIIGMEFTSTEEIRDEIASLVEDDSVREITLEIDSPGGTVDGLDELAGDIAAAAELKPVNVRVDGMMASAALYAGAQGSNISARREHVIGSIGTYVVLHDASGMAEADGVKVHVISSGPAKGGAFGAPIPDAVIANWQSIVDGYAGQFVDAVSKGRGMSLADASALATGEVWLGEDARDNGLVDEIAGASTPVATTAEGTAKAIGALAALDGMGELVASNPLQALPLITTDNTNPTPAAQATTQEKDIMSEAELKAAQAKADKETARADSLAASLATIQDQRRDELVAKYADRVSAENKAAVEKFAAFCEGDFVAFEAHLKSLPILTRSEEAGATLSEEDRDIKAPLTKGEREIEKIFGMSMAKINKLGARGTSIATGGTMSFPDATAEDGYREVRREDVAAYLKETAVRA